MTEWDPPPWRWLAVRREPAARAPAGFTLVWTTGGADETITCIDAAPVGPLAPKPVPPRGRPRERAPGRVREHRR